MAEDVHIDRLRYLLTPSRYGITNPLGVFATERVVRRDLERFADEFISILKPAPGADGVGDRYRRIMAGAMLSNDNVVLFRCDCGRPTPVYASHSSGERVLPDGTHVPMRPWEGRAGTGCLWCRRTIWIGWLTGWQHPSKEEGAPIGDGIMRQALGEAAA